VTAKLKKGRAVSKMDYRSVIGLSCWFAVAVISSVYMWVFADRVGDILFGIFLPVGALVLVALIVTVIVISKPEPKENG
jgi:hypothetical protein